MSTVLVYSDDPQVREQILMAVGTRPDPQGEPVRWLHAATLAEVLETVEAGGVDVCVLDGEAHPVGGLGISRQLKSEIRDCPATVVLVARRDDRWLAQWSQADAVLATPLDPGEAAGALTAVLRERAALPRG